MALQVSYTDEYGSAAHSTAYAVITQISIARNPAASGDSIHIGVTLFHDSAARSKADVSAIKSELSHASFAITPGSTAYNTFFAETVLDDVDKTLIKQAYLYVKTQTSPINFTGASDV